VGKNRKKGAKRLRRAGVLRHGRDIGGQFHREKWNRNKCQDKTSRSRMEAYCNVKEMCKLEGLFRGKM